MRKHMREDDGVLLVSAIMVFLAVIVFGGAALFARFLISLFF